MALKDWSTVASNNATKPSITWAEGMAPDQVNNSARQMMADIAIGYGTVTNADMKALTGMVAGQSIFLASPAYKAGWFDWVVGDYSAQVASDPLEGIYIKATAIAATAGCWMRRWDKINGYPEWFGAEPNNGAIDCTPPIRRCYEICPRTVLAARNYFCSTKLVFDIGHRHVVGTWQMGYADNTGTRLLFNYANDDCVQIGPSALPANVNSFVLGLCVEGFEVSRIVTRVPPTGGTPANAKRGVRAQYLLQSTIRNISSREHSMCFSLYGLVYTFVEKCFAFVSLAATTTVNDNFWGFYAEGTALGAVGLPGGNASLFIDKCNTSLGGTPGVVSPTGFYVSGAFVDTFIIDFHSTNVANGMYIQGTGAGGAGSSNIDFHVIRPVLDGCSNYGIQLYTTASDTAVEIHDPYIAISGNAAFAGIWHRQCSGRTSIVGGQIIGTPNSAAGGNGLGIYADGTTGLNVVSTKIINCKRPVGIDSSSSITIDAVIDNPTHAPTQGGVFVQNSTTGKIDCAITGGGAAFPKGVELSGSNNFNWTVEKTRIVTAAITGGAANKVTVNGVAGLAAGFYTAAGVASTAAAGAIELRGISL